MTLRMRTTLLVALAVGIAVIAGAAAASFAAERSLLATVDAALWELAGQEQRGSEIRARGGHRIGRFAGTGGLVQFVTDDGRIVDRPPTGGDDPDLPIDGRTLAVAGGEASGYLQTTEVDGVQVRILTTPVAPGLAMQVARSLGEVSEALASLRRWLASIAVGGIGFAALAAHVVAGRATSPLRDLTALAEEIARTRDLSRRLARDLPDDEVGRLAGAFDTMLDALDRADEAQRRLVMDAAHELRTPVTGLRTNVEVLLEGDRLDPSDRAELVADAVVQLEVVARMVDGLIELARGGAPVRDGETVRLDQVVTEVVEELGAQAEPVKLSLAPVMVAGDRRRIEHLVRNLVVNALRHGAGGPVDVALRDGVLRVRDHGPGFDPDELPHVFERFFRGARSRQVPGSGLGLAIVEQVVAAHGGDVTARNAPDGGAEVIVQLPVHEPLPGE